MRFMKIRIVINTWAWRSLVRRIWKFITQTLLLVFNHAYFVPRPCADLSSLLKANRKGSLPNFGKFAGQGLLAN